MRTTLLAFVLCMGWAASAAQTPAEMRIEGSKKAIAANPKAWRAYNDLALALARRARETGNPAFYAQGEAALAKSFELQPDNYDAEKIRVWLLLGRHEFSQAREMARKLNKRSPDDITVYGFLVDANVELGNYKEAEEAGQWMLDMSPGTVAGLARGAHLREILGDIEGALELMGQAYTSTPFNETEDRAWLLTQIGRLQAHAGKLDAASRVLQQALQLFPDYHYALGELANVRTWQGRFAEAVELQQKRFAIAPHAENQFGLAEALEKAGRQDEAAAAYREFEAAARKETSLGDNANHELVEYYLGSGKNPEEALAVAKSETSRRQDMRTRALLAQALAANGQGLEAKVESAKLADAIR
jgi:tetratricopeptide (TPR) repeat protein